MQLETDATPVLLSWSSGKDSAWTLQRLCADPRWRVVGLVTTTNRAFDRIAMHGVRRELLERQAAALGLALQVIELPWPCDNTTYEALMREAMGALRVRWGFDHVAFGDIHLADVRAYRERLATANDFTPVFPLWGDNPRDLVAQMLAGGLKARITCLDPTVVPREFGGRLLSPALFDALPERVDRCGENGEFHTFVCDGPMFDQPVVVRVGETVERDGFVFTDLQEA